jgi:hypothetical protein
MWEQINKHINWITHILFNNDKHITLKWPVYNKDWWKEHYKAYSIV